MASSVSDRGAEGARRPAECVLRGRLEDGREREADDDEEDEER